MLLTLLTALVAFAPPPPAAEAPPPILRFVNGTAHEVVGLYVTYCGAQDYWDNLLAKPGYAAMVPGATVEFRFPPGCYDLHATVDVDGGTDLHQFQVSVDDDVLHQWRIDFGGASAAAPAAAPAAPPAAPPAAVYNPNAAYTGRPGKIEFANHSTQYVVSGLFLAQCGAAAWGGDELGGDLLSPTEWIWIEDVAPGCWVMYARTVNGAIDMGRFEIPEGRLVKLWITDENQPR